jgi:aldehyde dehydrogenase (NAD+)
MQKALSESREIGAKVHGGSRVDGIGTQDAYYVRPALVELKSHDGPVLRETFAPILYVVRYSTLDEAIEWHNAVGAGLSSSIFTLNVREAERFLSSADRGCIVLAWPAHAEENMAVDHRRARDPLHARSRRAPGRLS